VNVNFGSFNMRKFWSYVFKLWIFGALIVMLFYEFQRLSECKNNEKSGNCIFSEIFDPGFGIHMFSSYIIGLGWPVALFSDHNEEKEIIVHSFEDLENTSIGVAYKCYVVSAHVGLKREADVLASLIDKMRTLSPDLNLVHEEFFLYTTETITNRIENQLEGDYLKYYDLVCGKPVSRFNYLISKNANLQN
jgi:hypothetical protein